ncbi:MAG: hypothetical protein AB1512_12415 [Thermodesulfobacteriota bacterium]
MTYNEAETRFFLIDPILRQKGYDDHQWLRPETTGQFRGSPEDVLTSMGGTS